MWKLKIYLLKVTTSNWTWFKINKLNILWNNSYFVKPKSILKLKFIYGFVYLGIITVFDGHILFFFAG